MTSLSYNRLIQKFNRYAVRADVAANDVALGIWLILVGSHALLGVLCLLMGASKIVLFFLESYVGRFVITIANIMVFSFLAIHYFMGEPTNFVGYICVVNTLLSCWMFFKLKHDKEYHNPL